MTATQPNPDYQCVMDPRPQPHTLESETLYVHYRDGRPVEISRIPSVQLMICREPLPLDVLARSSQELQRQWKAARAAGYKPIPATQARLTGTGADTFYVR